MASNGADRAVVDASVLLAHLNREEGRYEQSRDLLLEAEDGVIELWAPMVLQVEVVRWSREVDVEDPAARAKLDAFLDSPWLRAVEVDRRMARIARDVVARSSVRTGVDALYVATAVVVEAPVVYTWDDAQQRVDYEGVSGAPPPGARAPRLDLDGG